MNKQKGFTIIELIVVIAIIAVLAAIVMVNVTKYISQGKDASIKGNMSSMMTVAASYFDDSTKGQNSYKLLFTDPTISAGITAINSANGGKGVINHVKPDNSSFCILSDLNDTAVAKWCVDSNGYKGNTLAHCDATNAVCW